jgi:HSP20 family protein
MTNGLIRFNPEADLFRGRMDRVFNQMLNSAWQPLTASEEVTNRGFLPAVDIRETPEQLTLAVELPGLTKDQVQITLENQTLTISGERTFAKESKDESYHRIERSYGSFTRSFTLPASLDIARADARFDNGVLTIQLPKAEETKPRKIQIG